VYLYQLLAAVGGVVDSCQALVMSLAKRWRWESIWLVWSVFACVVFPWTAAFLLLRDPSPAAVLRELPPDTIRPIVLYSLGWGFGSILFGMGVVRVGMGLGLGISISLLAANGTLLPLAIDKPELLLSPEPEVQGIYVAVLVLIVGIVLCSLAAHRRPDEKPLLEREKTSFIAGILCCIGCGFLSPMFNMAIARAMPINGIAESLDAGKLAASTLPVAIIMTSGFFINAGYCVYLLFANQSWKDFREPGTRAYWFYGALMGSFQTASFLIYSVAANGLDDLVNLGGAVLGWPVYAASMIIVGNVIGLLRGEWKGSDRITYLLLGIGLAVLVVATIIVTRIGGKLG
jgi:L-rhamnose-H+ transport protein